MYLTIGENLLLHDGSWMVDIIIWQKYIAEYENTLL